VGERLLELNTKEKRSRAKVSPEKTEKKEKTRIKASCWGIEVKFSDKQHTPNSLGEN